MNALEMTYPTGPPAEEAWRQPQIGALLRHHDVAAMFRHLRSAGFTQQRIGVLAGLSQPEVSAIVHGRQVQAYQVLKRIFAGLGIPLCMVGMASCGHRCSHRYPADRVTGRPAGPRRVPAGLWTLEGHDQLSTCPVDR